MKNKEIRKIELNPPFDFLLRNQTRKIHKVFPHLVFEHYPVKSTKKEKFEHLRIAIDNPNTSLIYELIGSIEDIDSLKINRFI